MGIFSEIKKLFWTSSAVAKSAADKGFDTIKDAGEDLMEKSVDLGASLKDKAGDFGGDLLEKTEGLGGSIMDKAGDIGGSLKDKAGDLGGELIEKTGGLRDAILHSAEGTMNMVNKSETLKKAAATTEKIGEQVLSKGEELMTKGEEAVGALGSKILGEDNVNVDKLKNFTEQVGDKVMDAKDSLVEKAGEVVGDIQDKIDETVIAGKKQDAMEAATPQKDLQEVLDENEGSLLDGKDDFFSKAAAYADGNYHGEEEGKITIEEVTDTVKKEPARAAGFTDHDGDGNEMVDDAIIESANALPAADVVVSETAADAVNDITGAVDNIADIAADKISGAKDGIIAQVIDATEENISEEE